VIQSKPIKSMDPAAIITVEDYERPRTLDQFSAWWISTYGLFGATRAGVLYVREGKGLSKKFHDEAHPMLAFMRHYYSGSDVVCKLSAGTGKADAQLLDTSGAVIRNFQIATAVDGYTEAMRRKQLTRVGHVDALAKPDKDGVIPEELLMHNHHSLIREMAGHIAKAVEKKSAKGYDKDFALIVGFGDGIFDAEDLPAFKALVGHLNHSFAELYIVGIHGRIALP